MLTDEQRDSLVRSAMEVRRHAYVPYSKYKVGAALLTPSGLVYDGVNVENAVFPLTNCAERTALFKAVSAGERHFTAIAVVTDNGGTPCGACRQSLAEFGLDIHVIIADGEGKITLEASVADLLPGAFTAAKLP